MKKENLKPQFSGWAILFSNIFLLLLAIALFVFGIILLKQRVSGGGYVFSLGILLLSTSILIFVGFFTIEPNEAVVLILFGTYAYSWILSGIWFKPLKGMIKKAPTS